MNMKKLLALMLALVMVFSLAACAKDSDDDDKDEKETTEESTKPEAETKDDDGEKEDAPAAENSADDYIAAFEKLIKTPTTKNYAKLAGGSLASDELYAYMLDYLAFQGMAESDYDAQLDEMYVDGSLDADTLRAMDETEIADAQDSLDTVIGEFKQMVDDIDSITDEDIQGIVADGEYTEEEITKLLADLRDSLEDLIDKLDGAEITEGFFITATIDGEAYDGYALFVGDEWFSDDLFYMSAY